MKVTILLINKRSKVGSRISYVDIGVAAFAPFALVILPFVSLSVFYKPSAAGCRLIEQVTKRVYLMSEVLTAKKLYTWKNYYRKNYA